MQNRSIVSRRVPPPPPLGRRRGVSALAGGCAAGASLLALLPGSGARADLRIVADVATAPQPGYQPPIFVTAPTLDSAPDDHQRGTRAQVRRHPSPLAERLGIDAPAIPAAPVPTGPPPPRDSDQHVTLYSRGQYARVDVAGGDTTLFDGTSDTVVVLDSAARTYYRAPLKQWSAPDAPPLLPLLPQRAVQGGGLDSSLKVQPAAVNFADDQTLIGYDARKFLVKGMLTATPAHYRKPDGPNNDLLPLLPFDGIVFGTPVALLTPAPSRVAPADAPTSRMAVWGGSAAPPLPRLAQEQDQGEPSDDPSDPSDRGNQGGDGYYRSDRAHGPAHSTQVTGEVWIAAAPLTTPGADQADHGGAWAQAMATALGMGPLAPEMAEQLRKQAGVPLFVRLSYAPAPPPNTDPTRFIPGPATQTTMQVQSLETGTLPDATFQIPAGYTQIDPPVLAAGTLSTLPAPARPSAPGSGRYAAPGATDTATAPVKRLS